jgi:tetratricopeptide (TPR) repeat protein
MITKLNLPLIFKGKIEKLIPSLENEEQLRKKIESKLESIQEIRDISIILAKKERYHESVFYLKQCLEKKRKDTLSLNIRGLIFGIFELDQKAYEFFHNVLEIESENKLAKECIDIYNKAKPSNLRKFFLRFMNVITGLMMSLSETEEYRRLQGVAEEELGNINKAKYLYERSLRLSLNPGTRPPLVNWDKAHLSLAALETEQGNYNKAVQLYKDAQLVNPDNKMTVFDLAKVYELKGDLSNALKLLKPLSIRHTVLKNRIEDIELALKNGWTEI